MNDQLVNIVLDFFKYSETNPIIFTQISFWIFFTAVFAVYTIIHKRYSVRNLFLFLVSIFFYYKTSGMFFMLLLFTIANEFFVAKAIYRSENPIRRKLLVTYSVILNTPIFSRNPSTRFSIPTTMLSIIFHYGATLSQAPISRSTKYCCR
jgi:hypothetical protein